MPSVRRRSGGAISNVAAAALAVAACAMPDAHVVRPAELTGAWVRQRADGTWGDTLRYLADGRVLGSAGSPMPAAARWSVVRPTSKATGQAFCVLGTAARACQPFRLDGDTLIVGDIEHAAFFRRAR